VPAQPTGLPDLAHAVERLRQAIEHGEPVAIWGDFDADGQTSTALLLETLSALGARVNFRVPKRDEGHGIHLRGIEDLIAGGARLILTCDTGVTAHEAVARANQLGAEVIVTDHHVPSDLLPPAFAVVNPHRLPPGHPMADLTGVGVAYQVARALDPDNAARSLDLVALGTVADVGTLTGDNRYLVQLGLDALRRTARPGLHAVYDAARLRPEGITEEHIGFVLGPRLNALGRLADARSGVELLTATDATVARILATEVEGLNAQRQLRTRQVTRGALAQIERDPTLLSDYHALVLSHSEWPGGIVGIVAGRLAERFGKPTLLISTPEKEGQLARGSGRSVPGINLVDALTACAKPPPHDPHGEPLLRSYGGHPGAAGFSLDRERIPEFRAAFSQAVAAVTDTIPEPTLAIDAYVGLPDLTLDLVAEISRLAPFGPGNPALALAVRDLRITSRATIGRTKEHLRLTVEDETENSQAVFWWQGADQPLPQGIFDLALTVRASDYRGVAEVQVEWLSARQQESDVIEIEPAPAMEIRDYREARDPGAILLDLATEVDVQVWAEGLAPAPVESRTRLELEPCARLAVWSTPPGPSQWQGALGLAQPDIVYLFAQEPGIDERATFLHDLGSLAAYALRAKQGEVELERAAARLGHRAGTIARGLEYLAATGTLSIAERGRERWQIEPPKGAPDGKQIALTRTQLDLHLEETSAYRQYFRSAPASDLAR
jgi:single-stranded-DNA-specific exonuclease